MDEKFKGTTRIMMVKDGVTVCMVWKVIFYPLLPRLARQGGRLLLG